MVDLYWHSSLIGASFILYQSLLWIFIGQFF